MGIAQCVRLFGKSLGDIGQGTPYSVLYRAYESMADAEEEKPDVESATLHQIWVTHAAGK